MILYYALGGGLGHLARSFALISHAPESLRGHSRLLVSTKSAPLAISHAPCPMDMVPEWAMADKQRYGEFLAQYLSSHGFSLIITDTFPFGLLGELKEAVPHLPRVLVGRYLKWDEYLSRSGSLTNAVWPRAALMIEEQEARYLDAISRRSTPILSYRPVSLAEGVAAGESPALPRCCVVHSGPRDEIDVLLGKARDIMAERGIKGSPEIFTPEKGLFPLEHHLTEFSDIVSGAGYAACAAAVLSKGVPRFHLTPFLRKFDDQALRLERIRQGRWHDGSFRGVTCAAAILWEEVARLLPPHAFRPPLIFPTSEVHHTCSHGLRKRQYSR